MIRFITFLLFVLFFNACGVDTSSSDVTSNNSSVVVDTDGNNEPINLIDPNPVESGDGTGTDDNSTGADDNGTGSGGVVVEDSIFDSQNAIFDSNACNASSYRLVMDSTIVGEPSIGENGASFALAEGQGLEIASRHSEGSLSNRQRTWVVLYYKSYPEASALGQGMENATLSGVFSINYDLAWNDSSVANVDNTVYVRSDNYDFNVETEKPSCYRVILNSDYGSEINVRKVYR